MAEPSDNKTVNYKGWKFVPAGEVSEFLSNQPAGDGQIGYAGNTFVPFHRPTPVTPGEAETAGDTGAIGQAWGSLMRSFWGGMAALPEAVAITSDYLDHLSGWNEDMEPEDYFTGKVGKAIRGVGNWMSPAQSKEYGDSFWATDVPGALGSGASFIVGGGLVQKGVQAGLRKAVLREGAGRALARGATTQEAAKRGAQLAARHHKMKPWAGAGKYTPAFLKDYIPHATVGSLTSTASIAALGSMVNAVHGWQDAHDILLSKAMAEGRDSLSDEELQTAWRSFLWNGGMGITEAVPMAGILNRIDKGMGGEFRKVLFKAMTDGGMEFLQEGLQTTWGNYVAGEFLRYDENRELFDHTFRSSSAGGISGVIISLLASAIGKKSRQSRLVKEYDQRANEARKAGNPKLAAFWESKKNDELAGLRDGFAMEREKDLSRMREDVAAMFKKAEQDREQDREQDKEAKERREAVAPIKEKQKEKEQRSRARRWLTDDQIKNWNRGLVMQLVGARDAGPHEMEEVTEEGVKVRSLDTGETIEVGIDDVVNWFSDFAEVDTGVRDIEQEPAFVASPEEMAQRSDAAARRAWEHDEPVARQAIAGEVLLEGEAGLQQARADEPAFSEDFTGLESATEHEESAATSELPTTEGAIEGSANVLHILDDPVLFNQATEEQKEMALRLKERIESGEEPAPEHLEWMQPNATEGAIQLAKGEVTHKKVKGKWTATRTRSEIDLGKVKGSGTDFRILPRDVQRARDAEARASAKAEKEAFAKKYQPTTSKSFPGEGLEYTSERGARTSAKKLRVNLDSVAHYISTSESHKRRKDKSIHIKTKDVRGFKEWQESHSKPKPVALVTPSKDEKEVMDQVAEEHNRGIEAAKRVQGKPKTKVTLWKGRLVRRGDVSNVTLHRVHRRYHVNAVRQDASGNPVKKDGKIQYYRKQITEVRWDFIDHEGNSHRLELEGRQDINRTEAIKATRSLIQKLSVERQVKVFEELDAPLKQRQRKEEKDAVTELHRVKAAKQIKDNINKNTTKSDRAELGRLKEAVVELVREGGDFHGVSVKEIRLTSAEQKGGTGHPVFVKPAEPHVIYLNAPLMREYIGRGRIDHTYTEGAKVKVKETELTLNDVARYMLTVEKWDSPQLNIDVNMVKRAVKHVKSGKEIPLQKGKSRAYWDVARHELRHLKDLQTIEWGIQHGGITRAKTVKVYLNKLYNKVAKAKGGEAVIDHVVERYGLKEKVKNHGTNKYSDHKAAVMMEYLRMLDEKAAELEVVTTNEGRVGLFEAEPVTIPFLSLKDDARQFLTRKFQAVRWAEDIAHSPTLSQWWETVHKRWFLEADRKAEEGAELSPAIKYHMNAAEAYIAFRRETLTQMPSGVELVPVIKYNKKKKESYVAGVKVVQHRPEITETSVEVLDVPKETDMRLLENTPNHGEVKGEKYYTMLHRVILIARSWANEDVGRQIWTPKPDWAYFDKKHIKGQRNLITPEQLEKLEGEAKKSKAARDKLNQHYVAATPVDETKLYDFYLDKLVRRAARAIKGTSDKKPIRPEQVALATLHGKMRLDYATERLTSAKKGMEQGGWTELEGLTTSIDAALQADPDSLAATRMEAEMAKVGAKTDLEIAMERAVNREMAENFMAEKLADNWDYYRVWQWAFVEDIFKEGSDIPLGDSGKGQGGTTINQQISIKLGWGAAKAAEVKRIREHLAIKYKRWLQEETEFGEEAVFGASMAEGADHPAHEARNPNEKTKEPGAPTSDRLPGKLNLEWFSRPGDWAATDTLRKIGLDFLAEKIDTFYNREVDLASRTTEGFHAITGGGVKLTALDSTGQRVTQYHSTKGLAEAWAENYTQSAEDTRQIEIQHTKEEIEKLNGWLKTNHETFEKTKKDFEKGETDARRKKMDVAYDFIEKNSKELEGLQKKLEKLEKTEEPVTLSEISYTDIKYTKDDTKKAFAEFELYMGMREKDHKDESERNINTETAEAFLDTATPMTQELVAWQKQTAEDTGRMLIEAGVKVKTHRDGKWRLLKDLGEWHFPRMFKQRTWDILSDPTHPANRAEYEKMLQGMVDNGNAPDTESAHNSLRGKTSLTHNNDFFANTNLARGFKLPNEFYDTSIDAYMTFLRRFSTNLAQIEAFGQATDGEALTAWDVAKKQAAGKHEEKYIEGIKAAVYRSRREDDTVRNFLIDIGLPMTAAIYLSGPVTAMRNTAFALRSNAEYFGGIKTFWETGRALSAVVQQQVEYVRGEAVRGRADFLAEAAALDRLRMDSSDNHQFMLDIDEDYVGARGRYQKAMRQKILPYALIMQRMTEQFNRGLTATMAKQHLRRTQELLETDPEGTKTLRHVEMLNRLGYRGEKLAALMRRVDGKWAPKQEVVNDFVRDMVNEKQYGYNIRQHPLFLEGATGRILFQFQKWGFQRARDFARNVWRPAFKQSIQMPDGTTREVRNYAPLARTLFLMAGMGELYASVFMSLFYDRERRDAVIPAIQDGEDEELALLASERIYRNLIYDGGFGIYTEWINYMAPMNDRAGKWKSPIPHTPPSYSLAQDAMNMSLSLYEILGSDGDLGMKREAATRVIKDHLKYRVPMGKAVYGVSMNAMRAFDNQQEAVKIRDATKDATFARNMARRFAKEFGYDEKRVWEGGRTIATEKGELYKQMSEVLMSGDTEKARALRDRFLEGKEGKDRKNARNGLKASVRSRQPILMDGRQPGDKVQREFLRWAKARLRKDNYERIRQVNLTYWRTAARAGLK